jgi:hypothetical protein
MEAAEKPSASQELESWLKSPGTKTIGSLMDLFEEKSFAILFVLLMGVPAIPAPTGGATHVFEVITVLLALQLIAGRDEIWLPKRFREKELAGERQQAFLDRLMRIIRWLEKFSKPRMRFLFDRRLTNIAFGLVIITLSVAAFFAPPFSGLDTLPAARGLRVRRGRPRAGRDRRRAGGLPGQGGGRRGARPHLRSARPSGRD